MYLHSTCTYSIRDVCADSSLVNSALNGSGSLVGEAAMLIHVVSMCVVTRNNTALSAAAMYTVDRHHTTCSSVYSVGALTRL